MRTGVTDPAAAQRASYAYARALQDARSGNVSGALAASAQAQAEALQGVPGAPHGVAGALQLPSLPPVAGQSPGVTPRTPSVPIVGAAGAVRSPDLVTARDEIDFVAHLPHRSLARAKAAYRKALDDYQSGNRARSRREAQAAFDAAAEAMSVPK